MADDQSQPQQELFGRKGAIMSNRNLATIRKVADLQPIDNADNLELATVDGWKCVVKKGEFKIGDACVYIEIDSVVPKHEVFEFMNSRKYRVKTIRIRGEISQGLVMPVSIINIFGRKRAPVVGDDVTKVLGITKYISPSERDVYQTPNKRKLNPVWKFLFRWNFFRKLYPNKAKKTWPNWISKTDEHRIQNIYTELVNHTATPVIITEKLDGCSATYFVERKMYGWNFGVCSRNILLQMADTSVYWDIARKFNIKDVLIKIATNNAVKRVVLQGEIIGPKISNGSGKNIYALNEITLFGFNLFIGGIRVQYHKMASILSQYEINTVPYVNRAATLSRDVEAWVTLSSVDPSLLNEKTPREGIIIRDAETNGKKFSCKVINPEFLLTYKI